MKYISIIIMSLFLVGNANAAPTRKNCKIVKEYLGEGITNAAKFIENEDWKKMDSSIYFTSGKSYNKTVIEIAILYNTVCK